MKRISAVLICILIILSLVSCSSKHIITDNMDATASDKQQAYDADGHVLEKIKKQYPDAAITYDEDKYKVILENIDINGIAEISGVGVADAPVYNSLDEFYETLSPQRNIIFVGKKTGESRQYLPVSAKTGTVSGLYYTNSKVEVTKAFYGDVKPGDIITYKEFYAVFTDDGNQRLLYTSKTPPKTCECLFVLSTNGSESLYGDIQYHDSIVDMGSIDITKMNETYISENGFNNKSIATDIYTKYVINNDVALDRYELIKSAVKYKNIIAKNSTEESSAKDNTQSYDALVENDNTTLEEFQSVLDKTEIELIENLIKQYGEKDSSLAVK